MNKNFFNVMFIFKIPVKKDFKKKEKIFIINNHNELEKIPAKIDNVLKNKIKARLSKECTAYLYIEQGVIKGYLFSHHPKVKDIWHDFLPTNHFDARLFDIYVQPAYRGCEIAPMLQQEFVNDMYKRGVLFLWSAVNHRNYNSINCHRKVNSQIIQKNFLIKIFGRNIISIVWPTLKINILIGKRRNKL